ncbi:MAG TPA: phosphoglycerate kinase [Rhodospirillales bacterium]
MSAFKTIDDFDVKDKRVLIRADLNVPMKAGAVSDFQRIEKATPTIEELLGRGASVVVMSHLGRPKGKPNPEFSLMPVAAALAKALRRDVRFAADCIGTEAEQAVAEAGPGGVVLLENLRFHAEEEANDAAFAGKLAELGNIYVNDAFSCAHRAHASTAAIAALLPAAAGRLMQAELEALNAALDHAARPLMAVVGGAKVSTKVAVLGNLVGKVDVLAIGGGMANTFLNAQGFDMGRSLCERDMAATAKDIMARATEAGCEIALPLDAVVAKELKPNVETRTVMLDAIPGDWMMLDVGPATLADLSAKLKRVKTLVWNGPLGAFETPPFDNATNAFAHEAAARTRAGRLVSVAGGGDTVAALARARVTDDFSYVTMAGGAFLEWLEGQELPGIKALEDAAA